MVFFHIFIQTRLSLQLSVLSAAKQMLIRLQWCDQNLKSNKIVVFEIYPFHAMRNTFLLKMFGKGKEDPWNYTDVRAF